MKKFVLGSLSAATLLLLGAGSVAAQDQPQVYQPTQIELEVAEIESLFAKSMADRDFDAFASFIDDEAVFWNGTTADRGKDAVLATWKAYYDGDQAPFSWAPETVLVLASGTLARSSGPVKTPDGRVVAYFHSTWRKNAGGEWKIIFDKGQAYCPPPTQE